MLQNCFTKLTWTLQRDPFFLFLLKVLKDRDNLISLGTRSLVQEMKWILYRVSRDLPFIFVMCHYGENYMSMRRAQIYNLKWRKTMQDFINFYSKFLYVSMMY